MKTIEALDHHLSMVEADSNAKTEAAAFAFVCNEIDKLKEQVAHLTERVAAHDNRGQID